MHERRVRHLVHLFRSSEFEFVLGRTSSATRTPSIAVAMVTGNQNTVCSLWWLVWDSMTPC